LCPRIAGAKLGETSTAFGFETVTGVVLATEVWLTVFVVLFSVPVPDPFVFIELGIEVVV
jgi:hypothetical protein